MRNDKHAWLHPIFALAISLNKFPLQRANQLRNLPLKPNQHVKDINAHPSHKPLQLVAKQSNQTIPPLSKWQSTQPNLGHLTNLYG